MYKSYIKGILHLIQEPHLPQDISFIDKDIALMMKPITERELCLISCQLGHGCFTLSSALKQGIIS